MNGKQDALGREGVSDRAKKEVLEIIESLVVAVFLALLIRAFVIQAFSIPSGSMEPTLQVHDMLLANKFIYRFRNPRPGEVVIFKYPYEIVDKRELNFYLFTIPIPEFITNKDEFNFYLFKFHKPSFLYTWKDFIKRVVATEGDLVEIKEHKVFVNHIPRNEPYIKESPDYQWGPKQVPKGNIFVLGDNRNNSQDGHVWNFLPLKYVRGRALLIYWPPHRMGRIR